MPRTQLKIVPASGSTGARIEGLDLRFAIDDTTRARLREAFLEYTVLVFPRQRISSDEYLEFGRMWGELMRHPLFRHVEGYPEIIPVINRGKARAVAEHWHADITFIEHPPIASILYGIEVPTAGGDTQFANQYLAYETLSDGMKDLLEGRRALFEGSVAAAIAREEHAPEAEHPVVITHPETGRKALFVGSATRHFVGMTVEESRPILDWLLQHATRYEFTYRHDWSQGDIVIWDNRCTLHYAIHDYGDAPRMLHRLTIKGENFC
jgi:taurine dioxygenase